MAFLGKLRYRLSRWSARGKAYESALGNQAEWTSPVQPLSGPILITKEAGDAAAAQSDDPAAHERRDLGTKL